MAFVGGVLFGVSDTGNFYQIDPAAGGLLERRQPGNRVFRTVDRSAKFTEWRICEPTVCRRRERHVVRTDTTGKLQPIFAGGSTSVATGLDGATGLALSPLDFNLWHPTETGRARPNPGHGINASFDQSRNNSKDFLVDLNGRTSNEAEEGRAHFGLEKWVQDPKNAYFAYGPDAQIRYPRPRTRTCRRIPTSRIRTTCPAARWENWRPTVSACRATFQPTSRPCTSIISSTPRMPTAPARRCETVSACWIPRDCRSVLGILDPFEYARREPPLDSPYLRF